MFDPLREIALLEEDREVWQIAAREAIRFQEELEREQGNATQRILAKLRENDDLATP